MSKFAKILEYVLLAVGVVIIALFYVQNGSGQFALSNLADVLSSTTLVDGLLWWVYALISRCTSTLSRVAIRISSSRVATRASWAIVT